MIPLEKMVEEIAEVIHLIGTEWENKFIKDMKNWRGAFTPKQQEKIMALYDRACESPY